MSHDEHGKNCRCNEGRFNGAGGCLGMPPPGAVKPKPSPPPPAAASNVVSFRGKKYDDVLDEPSPEQFDPGAHRGLGLGRLGPDLADAVPPGSEQIAGPPWQKRRVLHVALREVVERVVEGKPLKDWRRLAVHVVHVDFGLPACLVWHRPNGAIEGMPWDRIVEWRSVPEADEKPYPPPTPEQLAKL